MQPPEVMDKLIGPDEITTAAMSIIRDNHGKEGEYDLPNGSTLVIDDDSDRTRPPDCQASHFNLLCGSKFEETVGRLTHNAASALIAAEGKRVWCGLLSD